MRYHYKIVNKNNINDIITDSGNENNCIASCLLGGFDSEKMARQLGEYALKLKKVSKEYYVEVYSLKQLYNK